MTGQVQHLDAGEVYGFLQSRPEGLEEREVRERRAEIGPNSLETRRRYWWLQSLRRQFTNFFSLLLDIAAAVSFVAEYVQPGEGMGLLGWALLGVSILNALFSFFQEYRAERAMEELRRFLPQTVLVRRGGEDREVATEDIVPGDVLVIREGQRIPADARLTENRDLMVNNAPLTGEAAPVTVVAEAAPPDTRIADAANLLFAGCQVLRGAGTAVAFATGFRTEFGRIATLSHEVKRGLSPLERETAHMVRILTVIAVSMGLVFFAYGVATGRSLWVNLVFMMGIIVANVPEGLLPTFTLSLAMGSLRMARRNVLVKALNGVEALGAVHVICTDKTGTLTENKLAVTRVVDALGAEAAEDSAGRALCLGTALAASDVGSGDGQFTGDPLDVAVANAFAAGGGDAAAVGEGAVRRFAFDPRKRRSSAVVEAESGAVFACKGAWESLRPLVAAVAGGEAEKAQPADDGMLEQIDAVVSRLSAEGLRMIAVARRDLEDAPGGGIEETDLARDMTLVGLIGLEDPIRPEVPDAVAKCHRAGIQVVMITGDHPETAAAVARRTGILAADADHAAAIVTGAELDGMRRATLTESLGAGVAVFARTTPEQKLKIVTALQEMGRVVAVTGDGVNDAPALKAADVGVAMGRDGTDVAREAAQVVLLDDNFASIVAGVEEGRTIFSNIRKFTNYVLVSNGPEIIPYLVYMLFPVPLALTVIQILSIDLGTDIIPSMGLGQEPPDEDAMTQPPRDQRRGLLDFKVIAHSYFFLGLIEATFSMSLFFWVLLEGGWTYGEEMSFQDPLYQSATGITLASILLMQIGNLFGRRSRYGLGIDLGVFRNPFIVVGIVLEIVLSWALLYFPPLAKVLGTGPVAIEVYALAWAGPFLIFGLDYGRKIVARRMFALRGAETRLAGSNGVVIEGPSR